MKNVYCIIIVLCYIQLLKAEDISDGKTKYQGYVELESGMAYNLNTVQTVSINNLQVFGVIATSHGIKISDLFLGIGTGLYHSAKDKENIYPIYADIRYNFSNIKINPYVGLKAGIVYDPYWIEKAQKYFAISSGIKLYKKFQVGCSISLFTRPSRFFTANTSLIFTYTIGK